MKLAVMCVALLAAGQGQSGPQAPALTSDQWREDLRFLARELEARHKNLFHSVTKPDFEREVARLDGDIPRLEPHQIVVRMKQITALVGDGHTGVWIPSWFKLYPLTVYWFGTELRVTSTTQDYRQALGAKVVGIGTLAIEEVEKRVRTLFPSAANENEWYALSASPPHLTRPEFLQALGVVPDLGPATFTFEDDQGKSFTLALTPMAAPPVVNGASNLTGFIPASSRQPVFRQRPGEGFWFTYLPDSQTVYVSFRNYRALAAGSRGLFEALDQKPPHRLIIDLRQNGGGDFYVGRRHLIEPIRQRSSLNQKGRLYVITGRRTYSAAMANAVDFRKQTNAILVGEPIGERPNSHSENDELTLPNSKLTVSYSTRYYQFVDEDVPAVMPDVRIDPTWAEFQAGRDRVLEWILEQKP